MDNETSITQRAHDLAVQATLLTYQKEARSLSSAMDFFEFGVQYRVAFINIKNSLEEGKKELE